MFESLARIIYMLRKNLLKIIMILTICVVTVSANLLGTLTMIKYNPYIRNLQSESFRSMVAGPAPAQTSLQKALDAVWQPVAHTKYQFHVYSAFVERRLKQSAVRVIAATRTIPGDMVFCRLWIKDNGSPYILAAQVETVIETHDYVHSTVFVLCLLNSLDTEDVVGGTISIVSKSAPEEELASNLLKIVDTSPKASDKTNVHVCVRPLHGSYDDVEWITEWIELNRILGVTHFYFYNLSIGDRMDCMLKKYQNQEELFTILTFQLPIDLWSEGQLASSHDCLYRTMAKADWLMIIDLDEVVVPRRSSIRTHAHSLIPTKFYLPLLFDELQVESEKTLQKTGIGGNVFELMFRNAFFYRTFRDDPKSLVPLVTSRKTRRMKLLNWYGIRSKYVVRPSKVIQAGVHRIVKFENESYAGYVSSQIALLHHYRKECIEFMCVADHPTVLDREAQRWSKDLWRRVQERIMEIDQACPDKFIC